MSRLEILETDSFSAKGRSLDSEKKIEVIGALPGEQVQIALGPKRKKRRIGFLREVLKPSPERLKPRCLHVPDCRECVFQQANYSFQLKIKTEIIQKEFDFLIQSQTPEVRPILECDEPWRYRNKMEFSFSQNKTGEKFLGLMLAGAKGKVFSLKECFLVSEWFSEVVQAVSNWWEKSHLRAYHHNTDQGHLRTLTVRESIQGKGKMVMLTVSGSPDFALKKSEIAAFVKAVQAATEEPLSLFLQVQQIAKGRPTQFYEMHLSGPDHITEKLHIRLRGKTHELDFKISPTSFFHPNTKQAQKLYSHGLEMLNLENAFVFDLYCGGATLGLAAAKCAREVVGIELNPYSVFDAQWNQEVNAIKNFSIHKGDVGDVLEKLCDKAKADCVIVDPPHTELCKKALAHICALSPKEILYLSSHPKTQAENSLQLVKAGYQLKVLQPIDQFPHTIHIENIALFQKT